MGGIEKYHQIIDLIQEQTTNYRMNIEELRDYCLSLPGATESFPFDEKTYVFFIMGKMFCATNIETFTYINVKCDPEKAIELREQHVDVLPGFHMNKKHWNSIRTHGNIPDSLLRQWIRDSYDLVVSGLPKKIREELLNSTDQ